MVSQKPWNVRLPGAPRVMPQSPGAGEPAGAGSLRWLVTQPFGDLDTGTCANWRLAMLATGSCLKQRRTGVRMPRLDLCESLFLPACPLEEGRGRHRRGSRATQRKARDCEWVHLRTN